jgi:hypothetical protein
VIKYSSFVGAKAIEMNSSDFPMSVETKNFFFFKVIVSYIVTIGAFSCFSATARYRLDLERARAVMP